MTKNLNLRKVFFLALLMFCANLFAADNGYTPQKREFRGAWIQCVNGQFIGMSTQKMQQTLAYQLDELQKDGVNAIFFQVRIATACLMPTRWRLYMIICTRMWCAWWRVLNGGNALYISG